MDYSDHPFYSPYSPAYTHTAHTVPTVYRPSYYNPQPPKLYLRFPEERKTSSLDARFDQSPSIKKILDYYGHARPSVNIVSDDLCTQEIKHVNPSVNKKELRGVYIKITPSIVSVSSFLGVERKIDCSGLIIDWNSSENEATILTSAKLLWGQKDSTLEFHLIVRMTDGALFLAKEDYVDYYHNLLTLKIKSTVELQVLDLRSKQIEIVEGMHVIALGRNFDTRSLLHYSGELYLENPLRFCGEILRSTCSAKDCEGGPLVTDTGSVVGINLNCGHLLPTTIIVTCLEMWKSFRSVVRPLFGMSVVDVDRLSYKIWEKLNISSAGSYVVVLKVSEGSLADINNVRTGDLVATYNGIPIPSAQQTSLATTSCGDSGEQSSTVVIIPFDRRTDKISIVADQVSVDDKRFSDCYPLVEWSQIKGSLRNPGTRSWSDNQPGYWPSSPQYTPT